MNLPPLYQLPGLGRHHVEVSITGTQLRVPDLGADQVERVWRNLEVAAAMWRRRSLAQRLDEIARVAGVLCARGPSGWLESLAISAGFSRAGLEAAWQATFAPLTRDSLNQLLLEANLPDDDTLRELEERGRVPGRIVHVLAGNVFPPTFSMMLRGWVLGAAQWLRPSTREPLFACCILDELRHLQPELAACTAVLWWPHEGSAAERAVLGAAEMVTVQGDDTSVVALQTKLSRWAPEVGFVGYGSRWSAAVVSSDAPVPETTQALARDIALFDQQGCLSPTLVLVQRQPDLRSWCAALHEALAQQEIVMPRGAVPDEAEAAIRRWREQMRLGIALGDVEDLWESPASTAWGVALLRRCGYNETPLDRNVVVVPFADLEEMHVALGAHLLRLQGLAVALEGWSQHERERLARLLRPTRVAQVGELQWAPPSWRQDHRSPLRSLLKEAIEGS